jgi:hypothetical protein
MPQGPVEFVVLCVLNKLHNVPETAQLRAESFTATKLDARLSFLSGKGGYSANPLFMFYLTTLSVPHTI